MVPPDGGERGSHNSEQGKTACSRETNQGPGRIRRSRARSRERVRGGAEIDRGSSRRHEQPDGGGARGSYSNARFPFAWRSCRSRGRTRRRRSILSEVGSGSRKAPPFSPRRGPMVGIFLAIRRLKGGSGR